MTSRPLWLGNSGTLQQLLWLRRPLSDLARLLDCLPQIVFSRGTQILLDALVCAGALFLSYLLRFEFALSATEWHQLGVWLIVLAAARPTCMLLCGTYSRIWRYHNLDDAFVFGLVSSIPSLLLVPIRFLLSSNAGFEPIPLSIIIIEYGAFVTLALSLRFLRRMTFSISTATHRQYLRILLIGSDYSLSHATQRLRDLR